MAEVRLSPDQHSVAIRSVYDENGPTAYGVFHDQHGGHWTTKEDVADWTVLDVPEPAPEPEPE